jgi:pimeloyl-ACP methyl ester carboxylesterase
MLSLSTRSRDPALSEFVGGRGRPRQPRFTDAKAGEEQVRRFAERDHKNIVRWTTLPSGGHFAAHKAPNELVGDIRAFDAGRRT